MNIFDSFINPSPMKKSGSFGTLTFPPSSVQLFVRG